eukprot:TRINITY_DN3230_c0_g1_i1.p1 TRINITY_DN3230_c0_g1~~TRINITY_DN3230_c0_g1_i1.p1  ORF type:complete len:138 (-),score=1.98 TRINITY_DN3230_c0_g1_i1:131-544(-)
MLYGNYSSKGLTILAFPTDQFFNQEPGQNGDILNCLYYVRPGSGYAPKFQMFQKLTVNGDGLDPLYAWMKPLCPPPLDTITPYGTFPLLSWSPVSIYDITWNFEKFLFDKTGQPFRRYSPHTNPLLLQQDIITLLNN